MGTNPIVNELRELLGGDVLLLPCKPGTKVPMGRWKTLTAEAMNDRAYLAKLGTGNIGVALGTRSGGLCSLDIDSDEAHSEFGRLNPRISATLRTRGARGGNIWWRLHGPYPSLTPLKRNGQAWGEWRADGAQTIIWGQHPNGFPYRILNRVKPLPISFSDISWPPGLVPPSAPLPLLNDTERTERTEPTEPTEPTVEDGCGVCVLVSGSIALSFEQAANLSLPSGEHLNHASLFKLARAAKSIEQARGAALKQPELRQLFQLWHRRAQPFLRSDVGEDDYFFEFLEGYENAMHPLGTDVVTAAWTQAQQNGPPPEAQQFSNPVLQQLVGLCRELWVLQGKKPFFLSCRTVQRLLGLSTHAQGARWLAGLRRSGILAVTEAGTAQSMRASRYQYLPEIL